MIQRQSRDLSQRLAEVRDLSKTNHGLRRRVQHAAARGPEMFDQSLARVGADLHDGPAQLLAFASLRLDSLRSNPERAEPKDPEAREADIDLLASSLKEAMDDIRATSSGLSLPDLNKRDIQELVADLCSSFHARTGQTATSDVAIRDDVVLDQGQKTCIYRFVQESLNNAGKHAPGSAVLGRGRAGREGIWARIENTAGNKAADAETKDRPRLGLHGLQTSVEALGGTLRAAFSDDGASVDMQIPLNNDDAGPAIGDDNE